MEGWGGLATRLPLAVLPLMVEPLTMWETLPLVLLYVPTTGTVMLTETMHVPPPMMEPPENEMEPAPAAGVNAGAPHPEVKAPGKAATTIAPGEVGKMSAKATPPIVSFWLGLVMVKVSVDVPPARIGDGENSLEIDGGRMAVSVAVPRLFVFV